MHQGFVVITKLFRFMFMGPEVLLRYRATIVSRGWPLVIFPPSRDARRRAQSRLPALIATGVIYRAIARSSRSLVSHSHPLVGAFMVFSWRQRFVRHLLRRVFVLFPIGLISARYEL